MCTQSNAYMLKKTVYINQRRFPNMDKVPRSKITDGIEVTPSSQIHMGSRDVTVGAVCLGLKETLQSIIIDPGGKMQPSVLETHTIQIFYSKLRAFMRADWSVFTDVGWLGALEMFAVSISTGGGHMLGFDFPLGISFCSELCWPWCFFRLDVSE